MSVLGKGLKFPPVGTAMTGMKKKLVEELATINDSLKGNYTIEDTAHITDITGTANSRVHLYGMVKNLYNLSRRLIAVIPSGPATTLVSDEKMLEGMIRKQLTDVLPGILQTALKEQAPVENEEQPKTPPPPPVNHTLDIERVRKEGGEEEEKIDENVWSKMLKKDVRSACKSVPVKKTVYDPLTGTTKMHFTSMADRDKAQEALKSKYKTTPKSHQMKKLDPELVISGLDPEISTAEALEEELLNKNVFIKELKDGGELLKTVHFDKKERAAVLRVSPKIREAIRQNDDKVCVDLERYNVKDRIRVLQCYHCQEYGHRSGTFCKHKESNSTCFYCAGNHVSKECKYRKERNYEKIKCSNCSKSRNYHEKKMCTTHKASDNLCPFFVREKERIMSRTAGCEAAKNLYLKRVKELQRQQKRV